jgi:hypothetical protein
MMLPKSLVLTVPTVAAARTVCASLIDRGYGINQTGLLVPESVSIPALVGEGVPTTAIKLTGSPGVVAAGHIAAGALGRANTVAAALTAIGVSAAASGKDPFSLVSVLAQLEMRITLLEC